MRRAHHSTFSSVQPHDSHSLTAGQVRGAAGIGADIEGLVEIQRRILWLAMNIIHAANRVRPNSSGIKIGGHPASSSSVVTILTELYFDFLCAGDRVSVKPHASPVLHAIHYLLGNLDRSYLPRLRAFHGLQAYPSRTKDPDPIDYSTGSVGLGAVAPNFDALVDRFLATRFGASSRDRRRFVSVVGDAELDEGSVWEAVAEPALAGLDNVIWIVDLNRQSLDRVVPGIRARQLEGMFKAAGWYVVEAKYGSRLMEAFHEPGGERLRQAIDEMSNEQYQYLLRASPEGVYAALGDILPDLRGLEPRALIADLGGHDFAVLRRALHDADLADRPAVVFAYTIKGWGLPIAGDPLNHSALLTTEQMADLRRELGVPSDDWAGLSDRSAGGRLIRKRRHLLQRETVSDTKHVPPVPTDLKRDYSGSASTQRTLGEILMATARAAPEAAELLVTVCPDVATSTNLGGWINKVGVWSQEELADPFEILGPRLIQWRRSPRGQHIELGISETNLMMLLGQLGVARDPQGWRLMPIGTLYDPFISRALDALTYSVYQGAGFILIGTPSGVTLAPEGGAHQSVITPLIGLSAPQITYWEPCFAQELEWIFLHSLAALQMSDPVESAYLRLSTAPVDQSMLPRFTDREMHRRAVLSGAYCIIDRSGAPGARPDNQVQIWACGIMVPEAIRASEELCLDGVYASVINCVSPDLTYRTWQSLARSRKGGALNEHNRFRVPIVTVIDGHPSALSWLGSAFGVQTQSLGVTAFGQSGTPAELYTEYGIDRDSIADAAFVALDNAARRGAESAQRW